VLPGFEFAAGPRLLRLSPPSFPSEQGPPCSDSSSGRKVLLPISALGNLDEKQERFWVRLTMQQINDSPDINADHPVSRQMENHVYDYYGWRPYWTPGLYMTGYGYMGSMGFLGGGLPDQESRETRRREEQIANPVHRPTTAIRICAASQP
jgi:hypothetical protein